MERKIRYFDKKARAEVIEFACEGARALWRRTKTAVQVFWCPRLPEDDRYCGVRVPAFSDRVTREGKMLCGVCLWPLVGWSSDENAKEIRGVVLYLGGMEPAPSPSRGETVLEYLTRLNCAGEFPKRTLELIGDVELLPREDPVYYA